MSLVGVSELLLAVFVASVMGSLHCVGMCGPFALMASGAGGREPAGRASVLARASVMRLGLYHWGRWITYTVAGALAGWAGAAVSSGGEWLGIQSGAARVAGLVMIALGIHRLAVWVQAIMTQRKAATSSGANANANANAIAIDGSFVVSGGVGARVGKWLASLRPGVNRLPPAMRPVAAGSLTTLLPCGWLYIFLLVAAGTGGVVSSVMVMWSFWLGTLPALSALVLGAMRFAPWFRGRTRAVVPVLGALLLLVTGLYTATGRASADLAVLGDKAKSVEHSVSADGERIVPTCCQAASGISSTGASLETLDTLSREPLPCCVGKTP